MKGKTLFYTSSIAIASNNLSSLHFASILTHTIARSHIFFSETKYCNSRSDVRSQLVPFSAIPRSWTWKRANLSTWKIHMKLAKIATTIISSQWWSGKSKGPMSQLMDECFLVLLFVNGSLCEPFHMKMSLIGMKMNLQVTVLWMVLHLNSFWHKSKRKLRNGLLDECGKGS